MDEDVVDVVEDVEVVDTGADDNFGAMQDRMDGDDSPWLSDSDGKVYDNDGNILADADGNPFTSLEDYQAALGQQDTKKQTAKPETNVEQNQTKTFPDSQSFDRFAFGEEGVTADKIKQMAEVGSRYKYNDELVLDVDPAYKPEASTSTDPVEALREEKKSWESIALGPIQKVKQALVDQQADPSLVDQILKPILEEQSQLINNLYQERYEKALEEKLLSKHGEKFSKIEQKELESASIGNIDRLAKMYYPEGGKDAFMALINGHNEKPGDASSFVRGPAAELIDFMVKIDNKGKKFGTEADRNAAYQSTFKNITADKDMANLLFNIAHYMWLGKKSGDVQSIGFNKGKQSAVQESSRRARTMKTRPQSAIAPAAADDDPAWFKAALAGAQ